MTKLEQQLTTTLTELSEQYEAEMERQAERETFRLKQELQRLDQIDQLVDASDADTDLGFMARLLALCSLPRTNPKTRLQYVRRNGPYTLVLTAGGRPPQLPYGNIPRLLLAWVCTEAVRTQSRELVLGRSLYEFMRKLGMEDRSGSARGDRSRLKNQMRRLFHSHVELIYKDARGRAVRELSHRGSR